MSREEIINLLRESMRLEVEITSEYTGGMDGSGNLYRDSHTINLTLDGEIVSSISL